MTDTKTMITKQDFQAYTKVQHSGATNMFDATKVQELSGLSKEKVLDIMEHYHEYQERWGKEVNATGEVKSLLDIGKKDAPEVRRIKLQALRKVDRAEKLIKEANELLRSINILK